MKVKTIITKSDFVQGMTCPNFLWLKKHKSELMEKYESDRLAKEGMNVGTVASNIFQNVTRIPVESSYAEKVMYTVAAMADGNKTISEAAFMSNNLFCQVDYLSCEADGLTINEVKAVTSVRKKNKEAKLIDKIIYDLGFQFYVLSNSGVKVKQVNCVYLNENYKKDGELDYNELFVVEDVTQEVISYVENQFEQDLKQIEDYLKLEVLNDCRTSDCKDCKEFYSYCCANLPMPNVFQLNGTFCKKRNSLYKEGYVSFEDLSNIKDLNTKTMQEIEAELHNTQYVDVESIKDFLTKIEFPIYFLDFETYQKAIPEYDGQWPYEQVPFQYSLDVIENSEGDIVHKEFLANENEDPRRKLAEQLVADIPMGKCVVAYNISFEKTRLQELAGLYPDLKEHLLNVSEHLVDLEVPFKKRWYYKKEMLGKSSIKKVLPALFPNDKNLDYSNLSGVKNGSEAMDMFLKLQYMPEAQRIKEREYMLEYCALDTFAMVKVWEALLEITGDKLYTSISKITEKYKG